MSAPSSGKVSRWRARGLWAGLILGLWWTTALRAISPQVPAPVTLEFRYRTGVASEVLLAWWPGRTAARDGMTYVSMRQQGDTFVARLILPPGTLIGYDFEIVRSSDSTAVRVWNAQGDPTQDVHVTAVADTAISVTASAQIEQQVAVQHAENVGFRWRGLGLLVLAFAAVWCLALAHRRIPFSSPRLAFLHHDIVKIVAFGMATRIVLAMIGYLAIATHDTASQQFAPLKSEYLEEELAAFNYADPVWYRGIAERGYDHRPFTLQGHANWSFYPLWPLILKASGWLSSDLNLMGILVSNLLFLVALGLMYRLIRLDFDRDIALMTIMLTVAFPGAYFFSRSGPESLFLLLSVAAVYSARKDRWLLAGLFAALGTLTKIHGILLLAPLLYLFYRQWRAGSPRFSSLWALTLPLVALAGFFGYMMWLTGNPLASVAIQKAWGNHLSLPFTGMVDFLSQFHLLHFYGWDLSPISFLFMFGATILTVIMLRRHRIPAEYVLLTVLTLGLLLSRNNLQASLRYLLPIFPLFLVLALLLQHRKWAYGLTLITFAALQGFYFAAFVLHFDWAST